MAKYFNQRHAIRSTWYRWADELNIRVFFMIGYHDFAQQELFHVSHARLEVMLITL